MRQGFLLLLLPLWLFTTSSREHTGTAGQPSAKMRTGKDYALFFAVDDYSNTGQQFRSLTTSIKGALDIEKELREMYGFETFVYKNPTKAQIEEVIGQWQRRTQPFTPDAQLFVFFSGHGTFRDLNNKGYFVPYLRPGTKVDFESYVELTDIGYMVARIACNHTLLAIDACYSGTIDQEIAFMGEEYARPRQGLAAERERVMSLQLRNKSKLLLTSGGKERTPTGVENSPFSSAIIGGLRDAYTNRDGLLTYADLLARLERVNPLPHYGKLPGDENGGFVFVSTSVPDYNVVTPPPPSLPSNYEETGAGIFVLVQGGSFDMGCSPEQQNCEANEKPVHRVTLNSYYIGQYEVTVQEFRAFIDASGYVTDAEKDGGSYFWTGSAWEKRAGINWRHDAQGVLRPASENRHPVIHVSWNDAMEYCKWLSRRTGRSYRLPTEAEWEFAARGGSRSRGYQYAGSNNLGDVGWYWDNAGRKTQVVGQKTPNELGLYDMSGNVWEWCQDWYGDYSSSAQTNPTGPSTGSYRVGRGGSWVNDPQVCRVAGRDGYDPGNRGNDVGFRLARTP